MNTLPYQLQLGSKLFRLFPPGTPGKARLARAALNNSLDTRDVQLRDQFGNLFFLPSLREPIAFHLLIDGVYEPETIDFVLNYLKPGLNFVDVGANVGAFTVPAAKKVSPSGRVLSIEPSPTIFSYLETNVRENGLSNVYLKQCAIFNQDANLPFYEAPTDHFGMGSLAPQFSSKPTAVAGKTLDHMLSEEGIEHVDLLKVDVEGFEFHVFQGARKLLTSEKPPLIVFELCDWAEARVLEGKVGDAQQVLKEWGYQIWSLSDFLRNKRSLSNIITKGSVMLVARKK